MYEVNYQTNRTAIMKAHVIDIVPTDLNALFTPLVPLLEGSGKVLFGPFPAVLEGLLGEGKASQPDLEIMKEEEVRGDQVR